MSDTEKKDADPNLVRMYKPNGMLVKVANNPANKAAAEALGWSTTKPQKA